uniref:Epoxide hydrolase n=1 Tax=Parastrongyloides trichosuri TaxID=131310 RepID=A0A0N4Z1Y0_PARTI
MAKILLLTLFPILIGIFFNYYKFDYFIPKFDKDGYFGEGEIGRDDETINIFEINIDEEKIIDMKKRVNLSLISESFEGTSSEYGLNFQFIHNVSINLLNYNWHQHQYFLNTFKHYTTEIEGLKIHFIRKYIEPKKNEIRIPLLIIHPFGMSVWDYYKIIPILTNPSRFNFDFGVKNNIIFDVIIPSIPGFGFSESSKKKDFSFIDCGRIFDKLMQRLSIDKYYIHSGGLIGNDIAKVMGHYNPSSIDGIHFTNLKMRLSMDPYYLIKSFISMFYNNGKNNSIGEMIKEFQKYLSFHIPLITSPDTISRSLQDSPLGFASYLLEYWSIGTRPLTSKQFLDGSLMKHYTLDELLTEVHIYWLTKTINSSFRLYYETFNHPLYDNIMKAKLELPVGISIFENSILAQNKFMIDEVYRNITRFRDNLKGGDFPMIEAYEKVAEEIFAFVELTLL